MIEEIVLLVGLLSLVPAIIRYDYMWFTESVSLNGSVLERTKSGRRRLFAAPVVLREINGETHRYVRGGSTIRVFVFTKKQWLAGEDGKEVAWPDLDSRFMARLVGKMIRLLRRTDLPERLVDEDSQDRAPRSTPKGT